MICATEHDDIDRLKALRILWFRNIVEEASFISRHRFRMSFPTSTKTCDSIDVCHLFLFFFSIQEMREKTYLALRASVAVLSNFITGTPT